MRAAAVAFAAALSLVPAGSEAKPPARDWSRVVTATPEGGFRMGNPNARVKLVEYGSLACSHCRHFEETGYRPLVQHYVRGGQVSYEFRHLLISGADVSATLLARCSGPGKFFAVSQSVFATQPQWQKKLNDMSNADQAALEGMTDQQRIVRYGEVAGLPQITARFGMTPARARQCLTDPKGLERLLELNQQATASGVEHTPTFLINGKTTDAATWEELEPLIQQAGKRG